MVMFDFADPTTPEFVSHNVFVDMESNMPRKVEDIDQARFPYSFKASVGPFCSFSQDDILTKDECGLLVWLAETSPEWLENTIPFWQGRNLPFLDMLTKHPYATEELYPLCKDIVKRIGSFISESFGEEVWPDQIGIVRWPPDSWQMVHKDDVEGLERVSGCVVFLNDDYEGGYPFYPYYGRMVQPKAGMVYAHDSGEDHLHGVTQIKNKTRYTISTTWTRDKSKCPYLNHFENQQVMV